MTFIALLVIVVLMIVGAFVALSYVRLWLYRRYGR